MATKDKGRPKLSVIVGIDPSTHFIGLCALIGKKAHAKTIELKRERGEGLPMFCRRALAAVVSAIGVNPRLVVIEEPFQKWSRTSLPLAWLAGALSTAFLWAEVISVPNTKWKKTLTGKGNATKIEVQAELKRRGYRFTDEHSADAIGLCLYGQSTLGKGEKA